MKIIYFLRCVGEERETQHVSKKQKTPTDCPTYKSGTKDVLARGFHQGQKKKLLRSDAETSDEISLLQVGHSVQDPWIYF